MYDGSSRETTFHASFTPLVLTKPSFISTAASHFDWVQPSSPWKHCCSICWGLLYSEQYTTSHCFPKRQICDPKTLTLQFHLCFCRADLGALWKNVYFDGSLGCCDWTVTPSSTHPLCEPSCVFVCSCISSLWTFRGPCISSLFCWDGPPYFWPISIVSAEFDSLFGLPTLRTPSRWPTASDLSHSASPVCISSAATTLHKPLLTLNQECDMLP